MPEAKTANQTAKTNRLSQPIAFNGKEAVSFIIKPLALGDYIAMFADMAKPEYSKLEYDEALNLLRIERSVALYDDKTQEIEITRKTLQTMPAKLYLDIEAAFEEVSETNAETGAGAAEIIGDKGDGLDSPIYVRLSVPVMLSDGGKITEIGFLAQTYSQLRGVVSGANGFINTRRLICQAGTATLLSPDGEVKDLKPVPQGAADKLSLADSLFIMSEVLPSFLPKPKA